MTRHFPDSKPRPDALRPPIDYISLMLVDGTPMRTIWPVGPGVVGIIDQTKLPHQLITVEIRTVADMAHAIKAMLVRGAPLIGAAAAYGMALATITDPSDSSLERAAAMLSATRPTAVNLRWAVQRCRNHLVELPKTQRPSAAWALAAEICQEDVDINRALGRHGMELIKAKSAGKKTVNILTHCNAGWLATVDVGTATAPIYAAHDAGLPVHVWVDETRPRNQGASLTAWELGKHGVKHTVIADNAGGHLMQHGMVDLCIVGADRVTAWGDAANKIGTYLKALAARDNGVPFYIALPSPTIDWNMGDGVADIPIEQRDASEVTHISGLTTDGKIATVQLTPRNSPASNWGFDVTPARLITGLITERGVCPATKEGLRRMFPTPRGE